MRHAAVNDRTGKEPRPKATHKVRQGQRRSLTPGLDGKTSMFDTSIEALPSHPSHLSQIQTQMQMQIQIQNPINTSLPTSRSPSPLLPSPHLLSQLTNLHNRRPRNRRLIRNPLLTRRQHNIDLPRKPRRHRRGQRPVRPDRHRHKHRPRHGRERRVQLALPVGVGAHEHGARRAEDERAAGCDCCACNCARGRLRSERGKRLEGQRGVAGRTADDEGRGEAVDLVEVERGVEGAGERNFGRRQLGAHVGGVAGLDGEDRACRREVVGRGDGGGGAEVRGDADAFEDGGEA